MRVLVVEDDVKLAGLIQRALREQAALADAAHDGEDALWMADSTPYDVMVLDINLPGISGFETCQQLRASRVQTPILMLTARDSLQDKLEGFRSGADDYLCKPFAFEELIARLRALVRRHGQGESLVVGDLRIDPGPRTASFAGKPVVLSPREYNVLLCLARASPDAVGRAEILDQVWGPAADIAENTVDVYVGYLRRRFAGPGGGLRIETVRGFGFRLSVPEAGWGSEFR